MRKLGVCRCAGFSLVEVLVAVVVFAIGLVGVASLQVFGLKSAASAANVRAVSLHLNELAEMMRMHAPDASAYAGVTCPNSTYQIAKDVCGVKSDLEEALGLPANAVTLTVSHNAADDIYTIAATWDARVALWSTDAPTLSSSMTFQL